MIVKIPKDYKVQEAIINIKDLNSTKNIVNIDIIRYFKKIKKINNNHWLIDKTININSWKKKSY